MNDQHTETSDADEVEGIDTAEESWGDYPIDDLLIRNESRTIHGVVQRIDQDRYVMDPDFQRDFVWQEDKQSRLIESVVMRIPLPVFYLAEDDEGRMIVVDGLQRLTTFQRFVKGKLKLRLPDRKELNGKSFSDLEMKLQNRIEDCNLIFYIIDSKVPERARLDIFERVNGGVPLTRQQMRNCLFMGNATRFLKKEVSTDIFRDATGRSLKTHAMRDREFVNRFCAFQILDLSEYKGDMDYFLARCLRVMNKMSKSELSQLSKEFKTGLDNNLNLFREHAFRKSRSGDSRRSVLNASLWDVMSTGLSRYRTSVVRRHRKALRDAIHGLLDDDHFVSSITYSTNGAVAVKTRFDMAHENITEMLGAYTN